MVAAGQPVNFPPAATEIKASWRPIRDEERSALPHPRSPLRRRHPTALRPDRLAHRREGLAPMVLGNLRARRQSNSSRTRTAGNSPPATVSPAAARAADCNRAPAGIGLEGTVWQNYRLRGTLTRFVDTANRPLLLANSELEAGMQKSSSCITCHARSSLALVGGTPTRLPIFDTSTRRTQTCQPRPSAAATSGYPSPNGSKTPGHAGQPLFKQLDFVWSLSKARPRRPPRET